MKQIITKKELARIQRYWNTVGGFGGSLACPTITYRSMSDSGMRIGIIEFNPVELEGDLRELPFYHNDTIADIKARCEALGLPWRVAYESKD